MMTHWLPEDEPSRLPPAATHYIGVAGFCLNAANEVLVIQENSGPAAGHGIWKLPGGLVDPKEDMSVGVVREVFEETGIETEFVAMAAITEFHAAGGPARRKTSDLYCVCVLRMDPEAGDGQVINACEREVAACAWKPFQELLETRFYQVSPFTRQFMLDAYHMARTGKGGLQGTRLPLGFSRGEVSLLHARL